MIVPSLLELHLLIYIIIMYVNIIYNICKSKYIFILMRIILTIEKIIYLPVHWMITDFVMAEPTCVQLITASCYKFTVSLVMLATKYLVLWISKWWRTPSHIFSIHTLICCCLSQLLLSGYPSTMGNSWSN